MLLAIDVGNTHCVFGLFQGEELRSSWRLQSDTKRTVDEYAFEILTLLQTEAVGPRDISGIVLSCVVPPLTRVFSKLARKYFDNDALVIGPGVKTGIIISVDDPRSVGSDRIVNAVAAKAMVAPPLVVLDMGTGTTFDVVSADGTYQGGLIAPGLLIAAEALFDRAAMLPSIELRRPERLLGKNTKDSMLAGIMFGYVGLVDGIFRRLQQEWQPEFEIVATGGLAALIAEESEFVRRVVPDLTLQGMREIATLNGLS